MPMVRAIRGVYARIVAPGKVPSLVLEAASHSWHCDGYDGGMYLYQGAVREFVRDAQLNRLADKISKAFSEELRYQAGKSEVNSWRNSLQQMSNVFALAELSNQGVVVELQLPLTSKRLDVMVAGHDAASSPNAVIIELKQWSHVDESALSEHVAVEFGGHGPKDTLHPSAQVYRYETFLRDMSDAFGAGGVGLSSLAFLHNLDRKSAGAAPLFDPKFADLLAKSPIYAKDQIEDLSLRLRTSVGEDGDEGLIDQITNSKYKPSKKLLDHVAGVIANEPTFTLLDEQVTAFNAVHDDLQQQHNRKMGSTFIINGGPGTGKSLIALQLLAAAAADGKSVAHATGSKAFTEGLRKRVGPRASSLLKYFNSFMKIDEPFDLLVADEAHRIRETSANRFTPAAQRGGSQIEELLDAAHVTAFFIDDRQVVRPGEVGSSALIREASERRGRPVKEYDLSAQFRCGGSDTYVQWVDHLLGVRKVGEETLNSAEAGFDFQIAASPTALEKVVAGAIQAGETSRLIAGFCWEWSDPLPDGTLVEDVVVGSWRRPWNARPDVGRLAPGIPSANAWAIDPNGVNQVGCVYTAQGFEFDRVGVIWGDDLVWRKGIGWMAQAEHSFDKIVKRANKSDPDYYRQLITQTYRVLLTRGMIGCAVTFTDKETEEHVRSLLSANK